jgi:hypothetical protein
MMIDGDPILDKDDGSGLEYVVNTPITSMVALSGILLQR